MSATAKEIASMLLEIGAIKLSPEKPFTWASGWLSPIYCDNRLTLSYPSIRSFIKNALAQHIQVHYPQAEVIAGVATAGVPQGALVADALTLPFIYVRPKPKEHGMANLIEGKIEIGKKVVVIEDLVSTGGSSLKAVKAIQEAGMEVIGMVSIFNYGFEIAQKAFEEAKIPLISLCNYQTLLVQAVAQDYILEEEMASLQEWRLQPDTWRKNSAVIEN
jgi:orotate phosphoribosyltransferase